MKNKKGFTLIELLAVIVILAVIMIIAIPIILDIINNARESAVVDSAYGYIDAIKKQNALSNVDSTKYTLIADGTDIDIEDIDVSVKGEYPDSGELTIEKGVVKEGELCFGKYRVEYSNTKAKVVASDCNTSAVTKTVTITFVSEGETIDTIQLNKKSKIGTFPSVTNGEYPLIGWFTEETGGTQVTENTQVRSDATYYAHWDKRFTTSLLAVGDLIEMTPSGDKFTPDSTKTGYSTQKEFDPKELNLWRIIKNDDGNIEAISEYTSTETVYFSCITGYANFIGVLNDLSTNYENSSYTNGSRHVGFSNQTEYITDTSDMDAGLIPTEEPKGKGDAKVESDIPDLAVIKNATKGITIGSNTYASGTLIATNPSGTVSTYWLASRYFAYKYSGNNYFPGNYIKTDGVKAADHIYWGSCHNVGHPIRPIIKLKPGIEIEESTTTPGHYIFKN